MTNALVHHYQLGESTFIFRGIRSDFSFLFHFFTKFLCVNRIAPDGTSQNAASDGTSQNAASNLGLNCGLNCLPMSHKRMPGLYELMPKKSQPVNWLLGQDFFLL